MKEKIMAGMVAGVCAVMLSGCVVTSLEPWFGPTHVVFDERLVGVWVGKGDDGKEEARYTITKSKKGYDIELTEEGKKEKSRYEAVLGRVANQFFLDVQPALPEGLGDERELLYQTHMIFRLDFGPDLLVMRMLKTDAAEQAVKLGQLRTVDAERPGSVLINTTAELQRFIAIHAGDLNLWGSPARLTRVVPVRPAAPAPPPPRP